MNNTTLTQFEQKECLISRIEDTGIFIYGNKPEDSVSITWKLSFGSRLSNEESWRAVVTIKDLTPDLQVGGNTLSALKRGFIFKLRTEDGLVYPCGIYDLEEFTGYWAGLQVLEICSRDQTMVEYR